MFVTVLACNHVPNNYILTQFSSKVPSTVGIPSGRFCAELYRDTSLIIPYFFPAVIALRMASRYLVLMEMKSGGHFGLDSVRFTRFLHLVSLGGWLSIILTLPCGGVVKWVGITPHPRASRYLSHSVNKAADILNHNTDAKVLSIAMQRQNFHTQNNV